MREGVVVVSADCRKDDLRNQRTPVLGNAFGPDDERNPRVLVDEKARERSFSRARAATATTRPALAAELSATAQWRGVSIEKDFRMRSTYGAVEGSTLEDWPIAYADLEPYYEKAEWEMGVSGDDPDNVFKAPRRKPLPMPPLPPNREYQIAAARRQTAGPASF